MYYLDAGHEKHTRMRNALLLACATHIILAAAVSFDIFLRKSASICAVSVTDTVFITLKPL